MEKLVQELRVAAGNTRADAELLADFVQGGDATAFEQMLRRHAPMVVRVCRRILGHEQDAEDAAQAAFLVLARKAETVRPRDQLAGWLFGVAKRSALTLQRSQRRRHARERVGDVPEPSCEDPLPSRDVAEVLDREIAGLPSAWRDVILLCDVGGHSLRDAAQHLNLPVGTLSDRLAKGRARLAAQLRRRGITLAGAGLTTALGQPAQALPLSCFAWPTAIAQSHVSANVMILLQLLEKSTMLANARNAVLGIVAIMLLSAGTFAAWTAWPTRAALHDPAVEGESGSQKQKPEAAIVSRFFLRGDWEITKASHRGKEIQFKTDGNQSRGFSFWSRSWHCSLPVKINSDNLGLYGSWSVDASMKPAQIFLTHEGNETIKLCGIIERQGHELRITLNFGGPGEPMPPVPTRFESDSAENSPNRLSLTLKRSDHSNDIEDLFAANEAEVMAAANSSDTDPDIQKLMLHRFEVCLDATQSRFEKFCAFQITTADGLLNVGEVLFSAEKDLFANSQYRLRPYERRFRIFQEIEKFSNARFRSGALGIAEFASIQEHRIRAEIEYLQAKRRFEKEAQRAK